MKNFMLVIAMGMLAGCSTPKYIIAPTATKGIEAPTEEWISTVEALAPEKAAAKPAEPRQVLVFSLATGFKHKVAPHVKGVVKVLGEKSGAFEVVLNDDISVFEKERLGLYDAVVLNNVCPDREKRDLFWDVLKDEQKAAELEGNLLEYVSQGGGLAVIHGAIAFQNNSPAVSEMMGGSFDWHPKNQIVTLELVDPKHTLVKAFKGKGFIHQDEPYLFKNAYKEKNFRPLLEMDVSKLHPDTLKKKGVDSDVRYVAWIKRYGQGRVFYCSPSHQPESYETAAMLRFLLDGIQYATGDLVCDDSSPGRD